ncbi:glycosyltransferase family 2 protein [uncultured Paraglaciecola sp.]|uniref:glycosyltransferase family 2 protein n=1 Tax=uncultured Paraglaciecola sp. TaxID=1765024 RepID=UPI0025F31B03|nr:glycosyltransferase family 2 protein [uncultured Paraglaciecola sp.]
MPDFSVIIPVYNRVQSLQRAINSVLAQSYQNFEIIIVDDGSCLEIGKKIKSLIQQLADSRISLLGYVDNKNGAAARNVGIGAAKAATICFLDSDDEWHASKLAEVKHCIQTNQLSGKDYLIHHQYINVSNSVLGTPTPKTAKKIGESIAHYSFITNNVGGIQSSTIAVNANLAKNNPFNGQLRGHQDWDFCLKIGKVCETILFIPKVLTNRYKDDDDSVARNLDWRYSLGFYILYRHYFSNKEAAFYFIRVVLKKASNLVSYRELLFNKLTFRVLFSWPSIFFPAAFGFVKQQIALNLRVKNVYQKCLKQNARHIVIWGRNNYCHKLILKKPAVVQIMHILDGKVTNEGGDFLDIKVSSLKSIPKDILQKIDLLILATDKYQTEMKNELCDVAPELLDKIIEL